MSVETASYPAVCFRKKKIYIYMPLPKILAVWNETPCRFLDRQESFRVIYRLNLQVIFQKERSLHIHLRENPKFYSHMIYVQNVTTKL